MIYVDYDDVVRATKNLWYKKYLEYYNSGVKIQMERFIASCDWDHIIKNSPIINCAYDYMRETTMPFRILTKCHSIKEANAKVKDIRENGITNDIIIVPFMNKKTDMVSAKGNILVDDQVVNLVDWESQDGIPLYFNKNNFSCHEKYPTMHSLSFLTKGKTKIKK